MDEFDQVENKKDFRKIIFIIIGVVVVAGGVTAFLLLKNGTKDTFNSDTENSNIPNSQTLIKEKPLFSQDTKTWTNYYWPGKINTHYPSDWLAQEKMANDASVVGLSIIPPTGNAGDTIFIGGASVKCSDILKYSKNNCLKNKIQIPFYTNSKNEEVLNAFDLIYQNSVLLE